MSNTQTRTKTQETPSVSERANQMAVSLGERAAGGVDHATTRVGDGLTAAAQGIRGTGEALSRRLDDAGHYLQESDTRSIGTDITNVIRNHPKASIGVGLGLGFLLGRLLTR